MNIKEVLAKADKYFEEDRIEEAVSYMEETLEEADRTGDWAVQLGLLNELTGVYRTRSQYDRAIETGSRGVQIIKDHGLEGTLESATTYLNLANVYRMVGRIDEARQMYLDIEKVYLKVKVPDYYMGGIYNNLCVIEIHKGNLKEAVAYGEKAVEYLKNVEGARGQMALVYGNLAGAFMNHKEADLATAREFLDKAREIYEKDCHGDPGYYFVLGNIAYIEKITGNTEEARKLYEKAMEGTKHHFGENREYKRMLAEYSAL